MRIRSRKVYERFYHDESIGKEPVVPVYTLLLDGIYRQVMNL